MKHFYAYPKIEYSNNLATNILVRGKIRDAVLENSALYYKYNVDENLTAELISSKYYGTPNYVWAIYYANNIFHPVHDWPKPNRVFNAFLKNKYGNIDAIQQVYNPDGSLNHDAIHHYEIEDAYFDSTKNYWVKTGKKFVIDKQQFLETALTKSASLVSAVSFYDYEYNLNESKKNIIVIDKKFLYQIVSEFDNLFD